MPDLKEELHRKLRASRAAFLSRLDNLSEYDRRRPMTPTGTNLLGLAKHLAGLEYGYLGESFGYPPPERLSWIDDGSIWQGADMWAKPDESSEYITGLYRRACAHADGVIAALDLEAPGSVAHWPEDRRATTLGVLLIRMIAETAQHAGHADIIRELIDGKGGPDQDAIDEATWREYVAQVQTAASTFITGPKHKSDEGRMPMSAPEPAVGERADLLQSLARQRHFLRYATRGLTDEQAAQRTTASELSLGGLIKHVALTERQWMRFIVDGPTAMSWDEAGAGDWMAGFRMLDGETLVGLLETYAQVAQQTEELVVQLTDLDAAHPLPPAPWFEPGARWSARRVLLHVIAETAQHAGHADIIRESLDGAKSMG